MSRWLVLQNTSTASSQRGKKNSNECPIYDTKKSDGRGSSNAGALGDAEYPFIAIAPMSTLALSDGTL